MGVHVALAPPDGFDAWSADDWDAWLRAHPWEPAEALSERGDWLVFLYQARRHAKRTAGELDAFWERLITERPIASHEMERLRDGLQSVIDELGTIPASRLWTGTQFYTPGYLHTLIVRGEEATGHRGPELTIRDLWPEVIARLEAVVERAVEERRGIYFGHVGPPGS